VSEAQSTPTSSKPATPTAAILSQPPVAVPAPAMATPIDRRNRIRTAAIVGVLTVAAALLALYAWRLPPFRTAVESTDNAYVRGNVTIIAPKVNGYVAEVRVQDFASVKEGTVLVRLDDRDYRQRVDQARANLEGQIANLANVDQARRTREAQLTNSKAAIRAAKAQRASAIAQLDRAQADDGRYEQLVNARFVSRLAYDQIHATLRSSIASVEQSDAAIVQSEAAREAAEQELRAVIVNRRAVEAAVEAARAGLQLLEIDFDYTLVRAPRDGRVGEVGVKLGQYVIPGTQLMALVPDTVWVIANFKEAQTCRMAPGQKAWVQVDALAGSEIGGVVERMSPATGSEFSVLKPDNATGNFTKVPQRLPVRIALDNASPLLPRLRPGMSVIARVDTGN
jgi:multidrug resistance efflux pump